MSDFFPADPETFPAKQSLIDSLLHAIGQPLSALQMCVLLRDQGTSTRLPPVLLEDVASQVITLSRLFCSLRELLVHTRPVQQLSPVEVMSFVAVSLPKWENSARDRQLHLRVEDQFLGEEVSIKGIPFAWLSELIETAFQSLSPSGSVTLRAQTVAATSDFMLSLKGGELLSESSHAARFALPITSILLQAPGQSFTYSLCPFMATLTIHGLSFREGGLSPGAADEQAGVIK